MPHGPEPWPGAHPKMGVKLELLVFLGDEGSGAGTIRRQI